ncbi:unnamed protein product [Lepeophtheirus salmonis]|uniref:(salmon louse) hypothetical protein n=1 Tax=Lepeophtheirus salmonis TaxID=72036 RepID=A0A7R8D009_LEPSM|nr:unnamed protein product [Lepeophtheirus salmonis]CAF2955238.1 unnamed protein product [Lepeophtheirus salmonis]
MKKYIYFLLIVSLGIISTGSVKILNLNVPDLIEVGTSDIELDCQYNYEEDEKVQLDIKWYFENDPSPFYQWVPGQMDRPQVIGDTFKDHLDLNHSVSDKDDFKRYRALLIKEPTVNLSGVYTCKVSSFLSEDVKQKEMIIYSPASSVIFEQDRSQNGHQVNITCHANGIFPQPQIKLTWGSYQFDDSNALVTLEDEGHYDIIVHRLVDHSDIPSKTTFGCILTIPGIDYEVREESVYYHRDGRRYMSERRRSGGAGLGKYPTHILLVLSLASLFSDMMIF